MLEVHQVDEFLGGDCALAVSGPQLTSHWLCDYRPLRPHHCNDLCRLGHGKARSVPDWRVEVLGRKFRPLIDLMDVIANVLLVVTMASLIIAAVF